MNSIISFPSTVHLVVVLKINAVLALQIKRLLTNKKSSEMF